MGANPASNAARRLFVVPYNATLDTLSCIIYTAALRAFVNVVDVALLLTTAVVRVCLFSRGSIITTYSYSPHSVPWRPLRHLAATIEVAAARRPEATDASTNGGISLRRSDSMYRWQQACCGNLNS